MLTISPIPAFADNYIWLLRQPQSQSAAVVDPGDAMPVLETLGQQRLVLTAILITHHHGDHTGGIARLRSAFPGIPVFGPLREAIPGVTRPLRDGQRIEVVGEDWEVLDLPGHTAGHIGYYGQGALFCGDTLFAAGCGRVFDGTLDDLHRSLRRLAGLPEDTRVYCAHEYTLDNLGFARWVEPDNPAILERERQVRARRGTNQPTLPSRLGLELESNPFLRTTEPTVIRAAETYAGRPLTEGSAVFAALRTWKDREYD